LKRKKKKQVLKADSIMNLKESATPYSAMAAPYSIDKPV